MNDSNPRPGVTSRIFRPGDPIPPDNDLSGTTMEERIAFVWELTKICYAWETGLSEEPKFDRSVTRVIRPEEPLRP